MNCCKRFRNLFLTGFLVVLFSVPGITGDGRANPLEGYTIHVTAPHMMDGEVIGPFHHYCKPISSDIIQCILFDSTDPNARLSEVEYMVSKKQTRKFISKWSHQKNWHDHKQEIETGRVAIINPKDPKKQKELADYVAGTDGIIFHLWPDGAPFPDGSVSIAQSVGHWEALHGKVGQAGTPPAKKAAPSSKKAAPSGGTLTDDMFKRMGIKEMSGSFK